MRVESVTPNRPPEEAVQRRQEKPRADAGQSARHEPKQEGTSAKSLEQELAAAIELVNRALQTRNRSFEFSVHEPTKEIIVRVIDTKSNEVVKEIPPEQILDLVAKMWELAGLFVDERL